MFSFRLHESSRAAKRILSGACEHSLSSWSDVYYTYYRAKRPLIDALDPATGRFVSPITHKVSDATRVDSYRNALHQLSRLAEVAYEDANQAISAAPADYLDSAIKRRDSAATLSSLCYRSLSALYGAGECLSYDEILSGRLSDAPRLPNAKSRQKLSRALASHLQTTAGLTADEASRVVGFHTEQSQVKPRTGTVVLSANILDLLLASECCSYSSCHGLEGCHCAGPQQYLADTCTAILYYYERTEKRYGLTLPYKTWRAMAHLDFANRSATLQRNYGGAEDAILMTARGLVARLLSTLQDGYGMFIEPRWVRCEPEGVDITAGGHAYADPTHSVVQLTSGSQYRPQIDLKTSFLCPECGECFSGDADSLVCEYCTGGRYSCCRCDCRLSEDDGISEDGDLYCENCWGEIFFTCDHCNETTSRDDMRSDEYHCYCTYCWDQLYTYCENCERDRSADDFTDVYIHGRSRSVCSDCLRRNFTECHDCAEHHHDDDVRDVYDPITEENVSLCKVCADSEEHRQHLASRLKASPLWQRVSADERDALARRWASGRMSDCFVSNNPSYLTNLFRLDLDTPVSTEN